MHAAGNFQVSAKTCSGICYNDFVIGSPSNYNNAYFEVQSVHVFGTSSAINIVQGSNGTSQKNAKGGALELTVLVMTLLVLLLAL
jgi:hypothetical protein